MSLILYVMAVMFYLVAKIVKKNGKGIFYHEDKKFTSEFRRNIDGGVPCGGFLYSPTESRRTLILPCGWYIFEHE